MPRCLQSWEYLCYYRWEVLESCDIPTPSATHPWPCMDQATATHRWFQHLLSVLLQVLRLFLLFPLYQLPSCLHSTASAPASQVSSSQTHKVEIHSLQTNTANEYVHRLPHMVCMLSIPNLKAIIYGVPCSILEPLIPSQTVPALLASTYRCEMALLKRIIPSNHIPSISYAWYFTFLLPLVIK